MREWDHQYVCRSRREHEVDMYVYEEILRCIVCIWSERYDAVIDQIEIPNEPHKERACHASRCTDS